MLCQRAMIGVRHIFVKRVGTWGCSKVCAVRATLRSILCSKQERHRMIRFGAWQYIRCWRATTLPPG